MSNFRFFRPQSLAELLEYKSREGKKARILDGGSNVLVYIKEGAIEEGTLVDVHSLGALKGIACRDGWIEIGAGELVADVLTSPVIGEKAPFLAQSLRKFANPLVRNMATLAGNIADSSPIGDAIPPLLVLGAEVLVASARSAAGERTIPLQEFFTGPGANVLAADEVIVKIRFPVPKAGRGGHVKLGLRKGTSCTVASVAVWLVADKGRVQDIRKAITRLAGAAAGEIAPISDVRGSAEYRRRVSVNLLAKAVRAAAGLEDLEE